ncbi:MAG: tetratricopeptide repeat protein [Bradymonadaceae bacterium]
MPPRDAGDDVPTQQRQGWRCYTFCDSLIQIGVLLASADDLEAGLEQFLELVRRDAAFRDDLGRRSMIRLFKLIPSEEVGEWRKKMGEAMWG